METLWFWVGTFVFVGTYVLIASEKVPFGIYID